MPATASSPQTIVTHALAVSAGEVINAVRQNARHAFLLDAKLGDANTAPMPDTTIADVYDTALNSIHFKMSRIRTVLISIDHQHGSPLAQIAERANDAMARAAIINHHNRRPPLYSENTISTFIKLGCAKPNHSPIIRAAGHVVPPPVTNRIRNVDNIAGDIAAHLAASPEPQTAEQILRALRDRRKVLDHWPNLDFALVIRRLTDIWPDHRGRYHIDEKWSRFLSGQRLVTNTVIRILDRDQQPRTTAFLIDETEHLVRHLLPDGYNIPSAVRTSVYTSDEISRRDLATFGLRMWNDTPDAESMTSHWGSTDAFIRAFLTENGPATVNDIVHHMRETSNARDNTVRDLVYSNNSGQFLRLPDRRVAVNPVPPAHNPSTPSIKVVPDEHRQRPEPVLRESELVWLTHYVQALDDLEPPLPARAVLTGPRATGSTIDGCVDLTVVADERHWRSLEPRLKQLAAATSERVQTAPAMVSVVSFEAWERQQAGNEPESYYNIWIAPDEAP